MTRDEMVRRYAAEVQGWNESEIRRLLGMWVSGLEPVIHYEAIGHRLLGLGHAGGLVLAAARNPFLMHSLPRSPYMLYDEDFEN